MVRRQITDSIIFLLVTVFGVGKIRYAPGTFGSAVAFLLFWGLLKYVTAVDLSLHFSDLTMQENSILAIIASLLLVSILLFIIGVISSDLYIRDKNSKDPGEVVIDELMGQFLTMTLCFFSLAFVGNSNLKNYLDQFYLDIITLFILPFLLFRWFDIVKPWPINWIDQNVKGGLGIMLDDFAAAILASLFHYAIVFTMIDLVK